MSKQTQAFAKSFRASDASNFTATNIATLGQLAEEKIFERSTKVMVTKPNGYKAVVFYDKEGNTSCVLFGKASADKVEVGQAPSKSWNLVIATNADGEERYRISVGQDTISADEWED